MKLFGIDKPLIGVIHLLPLPGAPGYDGKLTRMIDSALTDADAYLAGGLDGLIVENFGDVPFLRGAVPPATVAAMTAVAARVRALSNLPLGINVLRSDGAAALSIAAVVGAEFIRVNVLSGAMVTDQGLIEGCAAEVARLRASLKAKVAVWGDLLVKHAAPLSACDPAEAALDLSERAGADAIIVTGPRTGAAVDVERLRMVRRAVRRTPVVAGSGLTADAFDPLWDLADGFIVGTSLKRGGRTSAAVDRERVAALVAACAARRGG